MTPELRQALRVVAEALPPGSPVQVPREALLELLVTAPADDLTIPEAAEILHRAEGTVRMWCASGALPGAVRRGGREWRIPRAGLDEFRKRGGKPRQADAPSASAPADLASWRAHLKAS